MRQLLCLMVFLLLSFSAKATQVAVIDFRAALLQSNAGQAAAQQPRAQIAQMEQQLAQARAELEREVAELQKEELILAADEFQRRRQQIAQHESAVRNMAANMQRQAQQLEQALIDKLSPAAEKVLKQLISERKLDLVINRQLSLYAGADVDLTLELTRRLNEVQ